MQIRTIADLAALVRSRRTEMEMSQADLAAAAGVSRKWIVDLEAGKASVELGLAFRVLDSLGVALALDEASPEPGAADLDALLDQYRRG